jgi:hypothetical protein
VAGDYHIQLIVNDSQVNSAPATVIVTASSQNAPPNAHAGFDQTAVVGQKVTLDGRKSSDPDDDLITYHWTIISAPIGSTSVLTDANAVIASFTPDLTGAYVMQLMVNDGTPDSTPAQMDVNVSSPNAGPIARVGKDKNILTGSLVTLDGSQSRDPNGDSLTYRWFFVSAPYGSTAVLSSPTSIAPSFSPDIDGEYLVRLVVNDGTFDSDPDTILIVAASPNPGPNAIAGADQLVYQKDTVILNGTGSSDPDGSPITYHWSIVSAPGDSQVALQDPGIANPSFVADMAGNYVFRLTVNDGTHESFADTVIVAAMPITALAVSPVNPSVIQGQSQQFYATARFADGITKDVTAFVAWSSSDSSVAAINASGLATTLRGDRPI